MQHPCKISAISFASLLAFNLFTFSPFHLSAAEPVQVRSVRVVAGPDIAHLVTGAPLVIEEWQYHDLGEGQPVVRNPYGKMIVGSSSVVAVYDLAATSNRWIFSGGTNYVRVAPLDPGTVSRFGLVSCAAPPIVEVWSPTRQAWVATVASNGALCVGAPYPLPYGAMRTVGTVGDDGSLDVVMRRLALYGGAAMSATPGTARVRITWTPTGMPGTEAYAPLPLAAAPASNAIIAVTADLDGNGRYSPGEPYGVCNAPSSPYFRPAVTLTGTSSSTWRIDLSSAIANNSFDAQRSLIDRGVLGYLRNDRDSATLDDMANTRNVTIALCAQALNGTSMRKVTSGTVTVYYGYRTFVSTSRVFETGVAPWTEANLYEIGMADVGEGYVDNETIISNLGQSVVTNAQYNILINGKTSNPPLTNNVLATAYVNVYEASRTKCVQLTPAGTAFSPGEYPVFTWRSTASKSYERCIINIHSAASGGNILFTRESAPTRSPDGTYSMSLPVRIGWLGRNGQQFVAGSNYWWSVSMIDAKFQSADTTATRRAFSFASE